MDYRECANYRVIGNNNHGRNIRKIGNIQGCRSGISSFFNLAMGEIKMKLGAQIAEVFKKSKSETGQKMTEYAKKMGLKDVSFWQNIRNLKNEIGSVSTINRLLEAIELGVCVVLYDNKENEKVGVINSTEDPESAVVVTFFSDRYTEHFSIKGLTKDEYIRRAKAIRHLRGN